MGQYDDLNLGFSGERVALVPGKYGNGNEPGLEIVNYNGARETKDPELTQHSFLVVSNDGTAGTAFLTIPIKEKWLNTDYLGLVFKAPYGTEEGRKQVEAAAYKDAVDKAMERGTPPDQLELATKTLYDNSLLQAKVSIGTLFRLQDWAGVERSTDFQPEKLVGIEFGGEVELAERPSKDGTINSNVKSVFSKRKKKA